MFKKIISSGPSGAARAALDVALELNIPHGGWMPERRLAENGSNSAPYRFKEIRNSSDETSAELNVADSDGTLIIARGPLSGSPASIQEAAVRHRKPWLYIDLLEYDAFHASLEIESWLSENNIEVLNVAGPRDGGDKDLYQATKSILEVVSHLIRFDIKIPSYVPFVDFKKQLDPARLPKNVDDVVELLLSDLSLKDKFLFAKIEADDLEAFGADLVQTIMTEFRLDSGNEALLRSCGAAGGNGRPSAEEAAALIMKRLLDKLRKDYQIRVVK
jgi:hypothetical protein